MEEAAYKNGDRVDVQIFREKGVKPTLAVAPYGIRRLSDGATFFLAACAREEAHPGDDDDVTEIYLFLTLTSETTRSKDAVTLEWARENLTSQGWTEYCVAVSLCSHAVLSVEQPSKFLIYSPCDSVDPRADELFVHLERSVSNAGYSLRAFDRYLGQVLWCGVPKEQDEV